MFEAVILVSLGLWLKGAVIMAFMVITLFAYDPELREKDPALMSAAGIVAVIVWPLSLTLVVKEVARELPRR